MFDYLSMPKRTALLQCGLAAITSILLITWLHIRPLGILTLFLFCFWLYKTRCNLRVVPPPELLKKYEDILQRIRDYRQSKPTMFCAVAAGCLGALAILGHLISGSTVVLVGLVLAAIVSTKYNFKLIKIEPQDFAWSEKLNRENDADDEFIPEVNESNLFVLERASDLATISSPTDEADVDDDEKSDEIPSELLIPDSIPEIGESSSDDDDDLVPILKKEKMEMVVSQTSEQDEAKMEFKKSHFKRDSSLSNTSSSSEESLSKGLKFPDHTAVVDGPALRQLPAPPSTPSYVESPNNPDASDIIALAVKTQTQALFANSSKFLPSLVSGLMQWSTGGSGGGGNTAPAPAVSATASTSSNNGNASITAASIEPHQRVVTALDSSDDSDFEILENEDFK